MIPSAYIFPAKWIFQKALGKKKYLHEKCQANEYIPTAEQEQIQISETNIKLTTNK